MVKFPERVILEGHALTDFIAKYRTFEKQCYPSDIEFTQKTYPNWTRSFDPEAVFVEGRFSFDAPLCYVMTMFEIVKHGLGRKNQCEWLDNGVCTTTVCWRYVNTVGDINPSYPPNEGNCDCNE